MTNFLLIAVCMLAGLLIRKLGLLPEGAHKSINTWIIYLALPAVSFKYLPNITWSNELIIPVIAPFIVWFGGWAYIHFISKKLSLDNATKGGITLITGLSNTSFLGFPLVAAYYGAEYVGTAVICDQATFLILSTFGVGIAIHAAGKQTLSLLLIFKKVVTFPPFIGFVLALVLPYFIEISPLKPLFESLASTVAPLALFSIGLQLKFEGWVNELKIISSALLYKLIIAPALVILIVLFFNFKGMVTQVSVFEMAMPSLISAAVVANEYQLNSRLINLVVGVGIILSLITTAIWSVFLSNLV